MAENKIWLNVSLSNNLAEVKRIKIVNKDEDYELAFISLKESCVGFLRETSSSDSEEIPEFVMFYKPDDGLQKDHYFYLTGANDLEGMLDFCESGRGVRVIVKSDDSKDSTFLTGNRTQDSSKSERSSQNAEVEMRNHYSTLADNLLTAIKNKNMEAMESLCKDLDKTTLKIVLETGMGDVEGTVLGVAAASHNLEMLKFLLDACPDVNVMKVDNGGGSLLHWAATSVPCLEYLIKEIEIPVESRNQSNDAVLHYAASWDKLDSLKYLVAEGLDVEMEGELGKTPLLNAAKVGSLQCVKYLLEEAGADLSKSDKFGHTALHLAAGNDDPECVKYLLSRPGVQVDIESKEETTPSMGAASQGSLQCLKYLIEEANADVRKKDQFGNTSLHYAVLGKQPKIVEYLLTKDDVETEAKNNEDKTALDLAYNAGDQVIITLLKNHNRLQDFVAADGNFLKNYELKEQIGQGAYGKVFHCIDLDSGKEFAAKTGRYEATESERKSFDNEISVLRVLDHRNIVRYYGSNTDRGCISIFMELVTGGSVRALIKENGPLDSQLAVTFLKQMLNGLSYLHQQKIIHRDLKAANILKSSTGKIKIADFGLAKLVETINSIQETSKERGTPYWMAPEMISEKKFSDKVDIWGIGVTVFEFLHGDPPFIELSGFAAMFKIGNGKTWEECEEKFPLTVSDDLKDFVRKCTEQDPKDRPSAEQLLENPLFC